MAIIKVLKKMNDLCYSESWNPVPGLGNLS